jgi:hypothetical protein
MAAQTQVTAEPIATIPTKAEEHNWHRGERVLVWVADGGDDRQGTWEFGYGYINEHGVPEAKAIGYNGGWHITRWAPLPPAPKP